MSVHISAMSLDWRNETSIISYPAGYPVSLTYDGSILLVDDPQRGKNVHWEVSNSASELKIEWLSEHSTRPLAIDILAALEGVFTFHPTQAECTVAGPVSWPEELTYAGVLLSQGRVCACRDTLWQQSRLWLPGAYTPISLQYTLTQGRRHPRRAPKPKGIVYQRYIPWLGKTLSFRALQLEEDLLRVNRWMNEPAVAQIWQEEGDLDKHRRYLEAIAEDPHMYSIIASLDGEPFGYFEVYWAKENRITPFYDADDYDRGWHVLIGEPAFRGKAIATAWLTSISHYLFLDDPRTQRIVGEPRADHAQQVRNLDRSGYAKIKEFNFPHKRALLVMLLRERFFSDALWWPRSDIAM
ncbi:GNAT family N-acetyltransferase [Azotobacter armeniacus]